MITQKTTLFKCARTLKQPKMLPKKKTLLELEKHEALWDILHRYIKFPY